MNTREILDMSFRIEALAERIYLSLGEMFPEAKELFERLSCEESRHADIVAINIKLLGIDLLPPEFAVDMVPLIGQTIGIATTLENKVEKKEITLDEALRLSLALEESGVEAYVQKIMLGQSNHESLNYVKQFSKDCEFHAELIREFRDILELKRREKGPAGRLQGPRVNCWEFSRCGRQPGGEHERDAGICPAATEGRLDGVHGGLNAGRACWVVSGTSCRGCTGGLNVRKLKDCRHCDFYLRVREEERPLFQSAAELLSKLERV